jgi:hypothetical protein
MLPEAKSLRYSIFDRLDLIKPEERVQSGGYFMRTFKTAFFGLALAASALALGGAPASAIEIGAAVSTPELSAARPAGWSARCRRWRHFCELRHPSRRLKYRGCLALHGCVG